MSTQKSSIKKILITYFVIQSLYTLISWLGLSQTTLDFFVAPQFNSTVWGTIALVLGVLFLFAGPLILIAINKNPQSDITKFFVTLGQAYFLWPLIPFVILITFMVPWIHMEGTTFKAYEMFRGHMVHKKFYIHNPLIIYVCNFYMLNLFAFKLLHAKDAQQWKKSYTGAIVTLSLVLGLILLFLFIPPPSIYNGEAG